MRKEIPILFNGEMVRAILAGRKTQTRRVALAAIDEANPNHPPHSPWQHAHDGKWQWLTGKANVAYAHNAIKCPYGQPGDLLYVRETWRCYWVTDPETDLPDPNHIITEYAADPHNEVIPMLDGDGFQVFNKDGSEKLIPWRPSIHMPKSAARIWLEVESVRVERLQDINEDDAKAEGVQENACDAERAATCPSMLCKSQGCAGIGEYHRYPVNYDDEPCNSASESFETLWKSVYGAESWNASPWVWVVTFRVVSTTGRPDAMEGQGG